MKTILTAALILAITVPLEAEVWHEDTPEYRLERAKERLEDLKEMNWDWGAYNNRQRSDFRAEARELQRAINSGRVSYEEAYGEFAD